MIGITHWRPACVNNYETHSATALVNHHDYQTARAAPGEIADRFRNANPGHVVGYPMFRLERLLDAAELLRHAGFNPHAYRGVHAQSLGRCNITPAMRKAPASARHSPRKIPAPAPMPRNTTAGSSTASTA